MEDSPSQTIQLYTVQDLQAALKTLGVQGSQPVQTISPGTDKRKWHMESLEVRLWMGGVLIYP